MSTRTPVADGSKRKEPQSPARVIRALREAIPPPQEVGESRGGAAIHPRPPLAEMGGSPGRRVLEVPRAAEEEVGAAGAADVDKAHDAFSKLIQISSAVSRGILPAGVLEVYMWFKRRTIVLPAGLLLLAIQVVLAGCGKSSKPSVSVFRTPDDAGNALVAAAKSTDRTAAALAIFGPDSKDLISSGDAVQDREAIDAFVARYDVMHRWRRLADGSQILMVGPDNFAFPIPLKKNGDGQWFFDTVAGKEEILNRRIGRNELAIIDVCEAVARAENEYHSRLHDNATTKQYALKFISDAGKQNGLYWQPSPGQPESPLGPLVAFATAEGYSAKPDAHMPFHGYYFHMLKGQTDKARGGAKDYIVDGQMVGGFAFVAYPAEYGNSGIMTFIINQDGGLLQKDLGKTTSETATAMSEFGPDNSWSPVEE